MAAMDDRRIISTSKPMHKAIDSSKSIPISAADHSTDQPDSAAGDQEEEDAVYVKVTILAKKVRKTPENTTIQLKQLLVSLISLFIRALAQ